MSMGFKIFKGIVVLTTVGVLGYFQYQLYDKLMEEYEKKKLSKILIQDELEKEYKMREEKFFLRK